MSRSGPVGFPDAYWNFQPFTQISCPKKSTSKIRKAARNSCGAILLLFGCGSRPFFPECVARVPVSLWGCGSWAVFAGRCIYVRKPLATVRNRSREGRVAVPMVSSAKAVTFGGFQRRVASFRVAGVAQDMSKVVLCGTHILLATLSENALHFSWQAQHFTRAVLRCFCEWHCQRCAKWWQGANSVAGVAFCDMSWKSTEASHETSILRSVHKKTRRKTWNLTLRSVKFEDASHEMLVSMLQHVSSRAAGFCGAVVVSIGEAAKPFLVKCFKAGCNVVLLGRRGNSWHSNMFQDVSKVVLCDRRTTFATFSDDESHFSWQAQHFEDLRCHWPWQAQHFRRVVLRVFCDSQLSALREVVTRCKFRGRGNILSQVMKNYARVHIDFEVGRHFTPRITLYTPHFTLYTVHPTL